MASRAFLESSLNIHARVSAGGTVVRGMPVAPGLVRALRPPLRCRPRGVAGQARATRQCLPPGNNSVGTRNESGQLRGVMMSRLAGIFRNAGLARLTSRAKSRGVPTTSRPPGARRTGSGRRWERGLIDPLPATSPRERRTG